MGDLSCTQVHSTSVTTLLGARQTVRTLTTDTAHINNLYNTVFWALVLQGGRSERDAHEILKGTVSADKHEILFQQFGINYDRLPAFFRKGTTLVWAPMHDPRRSKPRTKLCTLHVDIISDDFWTPSTTVAHANEQHGEANDSSIQFYERPERLFGAGLGGTVLACVS